MRHPAFSAPRHGISFEPSRDGPRLTRQAERVWSVIRDGQWHTLGEISAATGAPEASVSARLRELRDPKFGGYTIERRYLARGLHSYRVLLPAQLELL